MLEITPQERLALTIFALLLGTGGIVRHSAARAELRHPLSYSAEAADTLHTGSGSPLLQAVEENLERQRIRSTPLREGERIDPNRATVDELARLPRIGPALAGRIVAHRSERGEFRVVEDLGQVSGIGPVLLEGIAPHLALPRAVATPRAPAAARAPPRALAAPAAPGGRIDVNRADLEELQLLPGIGPVLANRILEFRREHGPFRSLEELERVSGIGPRMRERLADRVRF